jgi:chromosomal replication initiation ATPase DnaA
MHVYRSLPNQSNASVGRAFDRDRTTVRHAVARVQAELKAEATLSSNLLRNKLGDAMCRVRVGDI